jgi:hypothetical protein
MFVLDALRQLNDGKLTIPSFHLGHLGFRPGLEVDSQYSDIYSDINHGHQLTGHELILTPFQGQRKDLFLFKCIFKEQPGVVARALSAFAQLGLNILSFESATIVKDSKHVLFCILSWAHSQYPDAIPLEESAKHKFIDALPILPTFDQRYIHLLESFVAHCFDAIEYEQVAGGKLHLPRISIKLFDDFYSPQNIRPIKIERDVPATKQTLPAVKVDLWSGSAKRAPANDALALLFSETETKALHVIFPKAGRERKFLHIGFNHTNKPGALLLIATLLRYCGFSIKTSLLRLHEPGTNVWEVMVEHVGDTDLIPTGRHGVEWFRDWCFGKGNPKYDAAIELVPDLRSYNVHVCRPTYPRRYGEKEEEFHLIDLTAKIPPNLLTGRHDGTFKGRDHMFLTGLTKMADAKDLNDKDSWLAKLVYPALKARIDRMYGQVFLSIPSHCDFQIRDIITRFESELRFKIIHYTRPDASQLISIEALNMIKDADYFFGVWHHDQDKPGTLSPWLPFEFGAAVAMGKRWHLIAHESIPDDLAQRIEKNYSLVKYDDGDAFTNAVTRVIAACKRQWDRN